MATKHPYVSGTGSLVQVVEHFRKSFPQIVTADTLKKLGYAPNNESSVIYILKFIGLIDEDSKRTDIASKIFSEHDDTEFQKRFGELIKDAYGDLFSLHGDSAWSLEKDRLISYFRRTDETSAVTGGRQAQTFQALAALSGHAEIPPIRKGASPRPSSNAPRLRLKKTAKTASEPISPQARKTPEDGLSRPRDVGLTVRIEINLPADGDQETYDRIFRSIRENLINGE